MVKRKRGSHGNKGYGKGEQGLLECSLRLKEVLRPKRCINESPESLYERSRSC